MLALHCFLSKDRYEDGDDMSVCVDHKMRGSQSSFSDWFTKTVTRASLGKHEGLFQEHSILFGSSMFLVSDPVHKN